MQVIGNLKIANKFYIINSLGYIEWVPSLTVAKKYNEDPRFPEWYGKPIYATNEDIVIDEYGRTFLKSQYTKKEVERNFKSEVEVFKNQAKMYIESALNEFSVNSGYKDIFEMISWKGSSIKRFAEDAKKAFKYRDTVYAYNETFIEDLEQKMKNNEVEELTDLYSKYIENFPKI